MSAGRCQVCDKAARQLCSSCRAVNYCSRDCQRTHWKTHKSQCRPYAMELHPVYGRHIVATRDIKAGEVLFTERPLVVAPRHESPMVCVGCHSAQLTGRCRGCGYPVCGAACSNANQHKAECPALAAGGGLVDADARKDMPHPAYACIAALRCLQTEKSDPDTWKAINNMEDHLKDIKKNKIFAYFQDKVVRFLREDLHYTEHSDEQILKMCGILTTNAFQVVHNGSKARALYRTASLLAHDCTVNTKHVIDRDTLAVTFMATRPILKGASITTTYSQTLWNTMARRQQLMATKFFACACSRCRDPTELGTELSTLLCDSCGKPLRSTAPLDPQADWRCSQCDHVVSGRKVLWGDAVLYRELREMEKGSTASLENFLMKYSGALHKNHRFFVEAKYALVKMYGNVMRYRDMTKEQLENKVTFCEELLKLSESLDPDVSLLRGSVLFEHQAGMVALAKCLLSNDLITEAQAKEQTLKAGAILKEASVILNHEPEMRNGGLDERLSYLADELDL